MAAKEKISIEIDPNGNRAVIMLKPDDGETITYGEVIAALEEKNVIHGILNDKINDAIESKNFFRSFTAAVHTPPIHGTDAKVKFLIPDETPLKTLEDGRVDFYNLDHYKTVNQGEPIIIKIPASEGVSGKSVMGKEISSNQGQDIDLNEFLGGKGVIVDPTNTNQIIASLSGVYFRIGNYVDVKDKLTVNHDIDFSIGSINVPANLVINGDIKGGFEIISEKNITVSGVIENAYVKAGGDIEVLKGIVKGGAAVEAGGKIKTNYIVERKNIKANELIVKNTIIGSNVWAQHSVKAKKIVGGRTIVGNKLEVLELGNANADPTRIEIGVNTALLSKSRILSREIKSLKQRLRQIQEEKVEEQFDYEEAAVKLESLLFSPKSGASRPLIAKLEERLRLAGERINRFNEQIQDMENKLKAKMTELEEIAPKLAIEDPSVVVKGTVYPNVTIKMGIISEIRTKKEAINVCFVLSDDDKIEVEKNY